MNNDDVRKFLKSSNFKVWQNVGFKIWMLTDYAVWDNASFNHISTIIRNPVESSVLDYFK